MATSWKPGPEVQPLENLAQGQPLLDQPRINLPHQIGFGVVNEKAGGDPVPARHITVSIGRSSLHDMSLTGFLELATPEPIRQDGPLILGDRSLDLQQQLVVRVVRNRMMKEDNLAASTPELLEKQDLVGILASQAIRAVDRQNVDGGIPDCIAQLVQGRAVKPRTRIALVAKDVMVG